VFHGEGGKSPTSAFKVLDSHLNEGLINVKPGGIRNSAFAERILDKIPGYRNKIF
jgi:hypothetical protein